MQAEALGCLAWLERHEDLWVDVMCKQMAGVRWTARRRLNNHDLKTGLNRLIDLDYVGVTDHLAEYMAEVCRREGWGGVVKWMNRTEADRDDDYEEIREYVYGRATFDTWCYEIAQEKCERALQQGAIG